MVTCLKYSQSNNRQLLRPNSVAELSWEKIASDFMQAGSRICCVQSNGLVEKHIETAEGLILKNENKHIYFVVVD